MKKSILAFSLTTLLAASVFTSEVDAAEHKVQAKETLYSLSQTYNTTIDTIKDLNGLVKDTIYVGQVLQVPDPLIVHTVVAGDSVSKIAQKYTISVANLKSWNNLSSDALTIGQVLTVSIPSVVGSPIEKKETTAMKHTVVKGDTLYKIARKYNVTVAQVKEWNKLSSDVIKIGQSLRISSDAEVSSVVSSNIVEIAKAQLGVKYLWGGTSPKGFDCSGFIYYVLSQSGYNVTRMDSAGFFSAGTSVADPKPGDLVFFKDTYKKGISHMGIYLGNNEFIHASSSAGITITSLDNSYWKPKFVGYKQF
ncbi:peptidoglycan endopeptidase [Mangrovibacillus cuniculi]|uniref:LysM peptidoglycan-binding domain-containing protein n=1 Tax=Mangrovibacillus cuniculi TaxID=2593652 RepID=A0A7S8CCW4_9BACI|nr:peptidoglycan endopeptidase [Mangrovibacillus cuniculi]QPC47665.1 LysM peptidoglycan-binding domain-containing protein [Mangrovibacillus cuniculi]